MSSRSYLSILTNIASSRTSVAGRRSPSLCFSTYTTVCPTVADADAVARSNSDSNKCCMTPVLCLLENNNVAASVVVSLRHSFATCG